MKKMPLTESCCLKATLFVAFHLALLLIGATHGQTVQTKLGKIQGLKETTERGKDYLAFKGIRYALAPEKDLRFKSPVPISPWKGVLDATSDGHPCPQLNIGTNQVIGEEDCLSLNIYTADTEKLYPVVVFIHGGGFISGASSSQLYGPDFFVDENVVLVTLQYRLGVLGFLSTGTEEAPGNWGLLDQLEALKWVKSNIASFGGDPDKVTLLGEGAGGASVSLLTLTSHAKGLFQRIITVGGSAVSRQYFQDDPSESARELASRLKCSYEDFTELLDCVKLAEPEKLVREVNNMLSFFTFPRWFAPTVDKFLFEKPPSELLSDGKMIKMPVMTGLGRHEGVFYYPLTLNSFNDGKYDGNFIDQRLPRMLPVISEFQSKLFPITKAVKKRYFTNIDIDNEEEFRPRYIEFLTDLLFTRFLSGYGKSLSTHGVPVYFFVLDYIGSNSVMNFIGEPNSYNVAHGDILQYLFTRILGETKKLPEEDEKFARKKLIPLLLNFAKTGNPTPNSAAFGMTWPKFDAKEQKICSIGRELSVSSNFRSNILKFWDNDIAALFAPKKKEEL